LCPCGRGEIDADGICPSCERDLPELLKWEQWERDAPRRAAEYAEAKRRYELAIVVECPYCGSAPGRVCRTAGPSGARTTKGVHVHADRWRAASDPHWKAPAAQGARDRSAAETPFAVDCPDCDTPNGNIELRYCHIHRCRAIVVKRGVRCLMPGESASFPYCHSHSRSSGFPHDFLATEEMLTWATVAYPGVDAEAETARFRQYWQTKRTFETRARDWHHTWRSWMSDAQQAADGGRLQGDYGYSRRPAMDQIIASSIIPRLRAVDA
jgi:hypothetical protein